MISALLGIVGWVLNLLSFALLIYCVMSFVMPQSDIMRKAAGYVEPVLRPSGSCCISIFQSLERFRWTFRRWPYGW